MVGFVGAPWTLAAYSVEGGHSKLCKRFKTMCIEQPHLAQKLLDKYTDALCTYASYQVDCGAQVIQVFESWAHHLSQAQFELFAKVSCTPPPRRSASLSPCTLPSIDLPTHPSYAHIAIRTATSQSLQGAPPDGSAGVLREWRQRLPARPAGHGL